MARAPKPCVNATLWEVNQGKHLTTTRRKDGVCENCRIVLTLFARRGKMDNGLDKEPAG